MYVNAPLRANPHPNPNPVTETTVTGTETTVTGTQTWVTFEGYSDVPEPRATSDESTRRSKILRSGYVKQTVAKRSMRSPKPQHRNPRTSQRPHDVWSEEVNGSSGNTVWEYGTINFSAFSASSKVSYH